jgi:hypothetical protein
LERTLIRIATTVSMGPNVGDLQRGDILIDGSKIAATSSDSIAAEDAEIIDAYDQFANPGSVYTHPCAEDRPLAIHHVQRVFHATLRLQRWVGAPKTTLVFVGARSAIPDIAHALRNSLVEDGPATLPRTA